MRSALSYVYLRRSVLVFAFLAALLGTASRASAYCESTATATPTVVDQWRRWQTQLTSLNNYASGTGNPYRTVVLRVTYTNCSTGAQIKSYGFWDEGQHYYIRGTFPAGTWEWVTTCSGNTSAVATDCSMDTGLVKSGRITVNNTTAADTIAIYKNGLLRPDVSSYYFTYFNPNRKFYWLGDTAWVASMRANSGAGGDWQTYVNNRAATVNNRPPFTVVQIAPAPMYAGKKNAQGNLDLLNGIPADTSGRRPFEQLASCVDGNPPPNTCSRWLSPFWTELDAKVEAANQAGLTVYIAGTMNPLAENGGSPVLPVAADSRVFIRNFVARMGGNHVIYSPGFDLRPTLSGNTFSQRIHDAGCALQEASCVVAPSPQGSCSQACSSSWQLVTDHPGGGSTDPELNWLAGESWNLFHSIQSSKCANACNADPNPVACQLQCILKRARELPFNLPATKPKVNTEAFYEGENLFQASPATSNPNHSAYRVRQAGYLSTLSNAVGYTFGTCGLYEWGVGQDLGCPGGDTPANAVNKASSKNMRSLRYNFQTVFWERLRSEPARIVNQAADSAQQSKMVVATDGVDTVMAYVPAEQSFITLSFNAVTGGAAISGLAGATAIPTTWTVRWLSPRTALDYAAGTITNTAAGQFKFTRPACPAAENGCDSQDWVLRLTHGTQPAAQPPLTSSLQAFMSTGATTDQPQVTAQVVDSTGTPTSSEIAVTGSTWTDVSSPVIAREPGGNSMVVWQSDGQDGDGGGIYARLYDSSGSPLGAEFRVNETTEGDQVHPSVTALSGGQFAVVWTSRTGSQPGAIYARTYSRTGTALSYEGQESCLYPGDFPRAGEDSLGNVVVAWESADRREIYAQTIDLSNNIVGYESTVVSVAPGSLVVLESVTTDSSGQPTITWQGYGGMAPGSSVTPGQTTETEWTPSPMTCR